MCVPVYVISVFLLVKCSKEVPCLLVPCFLALPCNLLDAVRDISMLRCKCNRPPRVHTITPSGSQTQDSGTGGRRSNKERQRLQPLGSVARAPLFEVRGLESGLETYFYRLGLVLDSLVFGLGLVSDLVIGLAKCSSWSRPSPAIYAFFSLSKQNH